MGVVDTGIDYNHPDLAANMWTAPRAFNVTIGSMQIHCNAGTHGFNAVTNSCNPMDDHSHGTHVAGTIGAVGNNGVGVTGVNWTASLMALKFITAQDTGTLEDAIEAIEFAIQAKEEFGDEANVRILSNSWGLERRFAGVARSGRGRQRGRHAVRRRGRQQRREQRLLPDDPGGVRQRRT